MKWNRRKELPAVPDHQPGATSLDEAKRARAESERSLADLLHSTRTDRFAVDLGHTFKERRT